MMIHPRIFGWCSVCLVALMFCGCPKPDPAVSPGTQTARGPGNKRPEAAKQASEQIEVAGPLSRATFLFTGDFQGFQRPCGCATAQHGGLPRLGTIAQSVGEALLQADTSSLANFSVSVPRGLSGAHQLWLVDCGNFSDPMRRLPGLRIKAHLAALAQAGAVAAVVNQSELMLSVTQATAGFMDSPVPLISCNVSSSIPGVVFNNSVQLAENWYLIGLAADVQGELTEGQGGWWQYADPLQSVVQALANLPDDANVVIAAAHQPSEVINELVKLNVRAVIGAYNNSPAETPPDLAPKFANPISRGAKLQLLSFDAGLTNGYKPWFIVSGEEWPDDPAVGELLKAHQAQQKQQLAAKLAARYGEGGYGNISWGMDNKYLPKTGVAEGGLGGLHYLGSSQCQGCHGDEYAVWEKSRHASAWESLVEASEQETLDCLQCHTTGLLEPGGYSPFAHDDRLVSVGCESCHGPGSSHLEWAAAGADGKTGNGISRSSRNDCLACHDSYNSPQFEAGAYWGMVGH